MTESRDDRLRRFYRTSHTVRLDLSSRILILENIDRELKKRMFECKTIQEKEELFFPFIGYFNPREMKSLWNNYEQFSITDTDKLKFFNAMESQDSIMYFNIYEDLAYCIDKCSERFPWVKVCAYF